MTIASQTSRISYNGDGSTLAFAVPFKFNASSDLVVYLRDAIGDQTLQVLGTNYSVSGAGLDAGGTVTFVLPPASGYTVVIYRDPPVTQTTSYNNNDPFPAKSHENALDKLTMLIQRVANRVSRTLTFSETSGSANLVLPEPEAGQYLKWRVDELGLENAGTITTPPNNYAIATTSEAQAGTLDTVLLSALKGTQQTAARLGVPPAFFNTKADATAFATPAIVPYLFTDGRISAGQGRGWWTPVAGNVAPAHGEYILSGGRYFEPSIDGAIFLTQFGADGSFTNDNNAAFQRAIAFAANKGLSIHYLPPGQYKLSTALPDITQSFRLIGAARGVLGNGISAISRCYNEADSTRGCFNFVGAQGIGLEHLTIVAQLNSAGGSSFTVKSTASVAAGYSSFDSLYCTADAGSSWNNTVAIIGDLHVSGARSNFIDRCQFFGGSNNSGYFSSCIHLIMNGGGFFQAGGTVGNVTISGGTGAGVAVHPASEDVKFSCEQIGGAIALDHCGFVTIDATQIGGSISNASTVNNTRIRGRFTAGGGYTCANNWDKPTCFFNGANITESSSTDGYIYREDGRIEQWMQVNVTNSAVAYNFPIAFPTKCLTVELTPKGVNASDQVTISAGGITASQVAIIGTGSITAFVRAIGY